MKKLFTFLVICVIANISLSAQYKYFVGGQLGFTSNDVSSNFSLKPNVGYILNDNIVLIGEVGFSSSKIENVGGDIKSNTFGLAVGMRYGWKAGDHAFVFLSPALNFGSGKNGSLKSTNYGLNIRPGVTYWLAPRWSMTSHFGSLGYNSTKVEKSDAVGSFGLLLDMNTLDFGINYHF